MARTEREAEAALRAGEHPPRLRDRPAAQPRHDAPRALRDRSGDRLLGGGARPAAPAPPCSAGAPAAGADAGVAATAGSAGAAGAGCGTGAGLWRSGASSHGGPVKLGNGASSAPPAAPVAGTWRKQSAARPLSVITAPPASVFSPTGTYSSGWSNGADWFFTRGSVSALRNSTRSSLSWSLRLSVSRFGLFSALSKSPPRL